MERMEIVVSMRDEPTKFSVVPFEGLAASIPNIRTMTFLWDSNSYHVNAEDRTFIINGGRKLKPEGIDGWDGAQVIYRRRSRVSIDVNSSEKKDAVMVTWLVGLEGVKDGERCVRLVHVGPGGRQWRWRSGL